MQKILPKIINNCGECPYYIPIPQLGQGTCSLLASKQYVSNIICSSYNTNMDCPLENYREWSEEKMK